MTINRDRDVSEVQCDTCGEITKEYDKEDFYVMIEDIKSDGWHMKRDDKTGEWEHTCPTCVKKQEGMINDNR